MTAETSACVSATHLLLERPWRLAESSRRTLLGPRKFIAGGSDAQVLPSVRKRLTAGTLPLVDGRVWGQTGSGRRCAVCDVPIGSAEVEYEPQAEPGLSAHVACFRLWLDESRLVEGAGFETL